MSQNKKIFSFQQGFLLLVVLINVLIIKTAYTKTHDSYWLLLLSIPMLFFAIYFERRVANKAIKDVKRIINTAKFHKKDNSISPRAIKSEELKVMFGNSYCAQPYLSSIICFDSVSADQNVKFMPREIVLSGNNEYTQNMIESLNDSLFSDDCIWRIGPDYAGCRDNSFRFNAEVFKANAVKPHVKMIELKLLEFNDKANIPARNISYSKQTNDRRYTGSHDVHTAFRNAESMVIFLDTLRQLSGKKPIGISLSITNKKEFHEMCYAFCKTHIIPDFIVVEGCEKENIFLNNISPNPGMPLFEALQFVSKTLEMYGLSKETKIIAASEIHSAFDILKLRALGADAVSMRNRITRGEKPYQKNGIGSSAFARQCMERFRSEILNGTMNIMQSWGYINMKDVTLSSFFRSLDALYSKGVSHDHNQEEWDVSEKKSYRLPQKGSYEKNMGAEVFLN